MIPNPIVSQTQFSFPDLRLVVYITGWIASFYELAHPQTRRRPRTFSLTQILSILVIKEFSQQSFRSIGSWFHQHPEYLLLCGLDRCPSFQTLSYRCTRMDYHGLIRLSLFVFRITQPLYRFFRIGAVDGIIVKPCKAHRAQGTLYKHRDPNAYWIASTKQLFEFGYKVVLGCDAVSGLIQGYRFFTQNVSEMVGLRALMSCFKTFSYLLLDAAYDSIYCFCLLRKETAVLPIIDINRRTTGKDPSENDNSIRWLMKSIRAQYKALYRKRWEKKRINNVLESQFTMEFIYYTRNRYYEQAVGIKILSYNIQVICNRLFDRPHKKKIVT